MIARFIRSDAMAEQAGPAPDREIEAEWFQLTYNTLRVSPDGDDIADFDADADVWRTLDGRCYSDIVFG
jgi:hypothetical protein